MVKWESEKNGNRYIEFIGTTLLPPCIDNSDCQNSHIKKYLKRNNKAFGEVNALWQYSIDCVYKTFNREKDFASWKPLWIDQTAMPVAEKYCPIEEWSKLPNK